MNKLLLTLLLVAGCDGAALDPSTRDGTVTGAQVETGCGAPLDQICDDTTCTVMGEKYPATLSGWCELDRDDALDGVSASKVGEVGCQGYRLVSSPIGDQSLSLYYDSSGRIVAIARYGSQPPCEGACTVSCVSGPMGFDVSSFDQCLADSFLTCGA